MNSRLSNSAALACLLAAALVRTSGAAAEPAVASDARPTEWPMLHGNAEHTGFVPSELKLPLHLAWARDFGGERLGTAMEPIVARGRVFVATHRGSVWALEAGSGTPVWRFRAAGPFLQAPACADGRVIAACTDGTLNALAAEDGRMLWCVFAGHGGFSASPVIADGVAHVGTRAGDLMAVALASGRLLWKAALGAPVRQTAAVADGRVFVTAEDLHVHCLDAADGRRVWTSPALAGQTARDYYPVIARSQRRTLVIIRTNPILEMGQRIGRDRTLLCRNAGVDDSSWQKVEAWIKSPEATGNPELWAREQAAIVDYLERERDARSFFVLDAATGQEAFTAPVLWAAGCQSVGAPPTVSADGRLLVLHRSAYGNWNLGVAPLVSLGLLDPQTQRIIPLAHQNGAQPPWNTFWGTADESQNFVVAGNSALIVHQGTLSRFGLESRQLSTISGERDTYGGFRSPPWARNEWHGPGRGAVALAGERVYWLTGSRLLCLAAGPSQGPLEPSTIDGSTVATFTAPARLALDRGQLTQWLVQSASEILERRWAPLFVEPGLAGRDFSFDNSGALFDALAWAYPHLPKALQTRAKAVLAEEWRAYPPFARESWYSLKQGARREWFSSSEALWARAGQDKPHHPFGNVHAVWRYAQRCYEEPRVLSAWPQIKPVFEDFLGTSWRLDGAKGDLHANRYLASLLAIAAIAARAGDEQTAGLAQAKARETTEALVAWWRRAAGRGTLTRFNGSGELDPFIGAGDALSFKIAPHRHKLALFNSLTPEVARLVREQAPDAVARVWDAFSALYATWSLVGEERQVHFGENFVDPPDLALGAFEALAWLRAAPAQELARHVDLPFCRADLYHLTKLAIALETNL
jgi:outer membrane protein assembly factor BamB